LWGIHAHETDVANLDSEDSVLLLRHKFAFDGVIRVIQVEVFKVNLCKSFDKVYPTVVAEKLRFTNRVLHHLTGKRIMGYQNLGQGLLQSPGHGFKRQVGGVLVTEKHTHVDSGKKQV
jgi:hypothetical protein